MEKTFRQKWLEAVDRKNSVLCAGLDPAEFEMERGEKGLSRETHKGEWTRQYINAVAPYCVALKPNTQYWKNFGGMKDLRGAIGFAKSLGLVVIEDSKLADIGSTNDAGIYYAAKKQADAITFSPFAGNLEEATEQAHARGLGLISMCLMSNPEFEREKNKLVQIASSDLETYNNEDLGYIANLPDEEYTKQYIQLAHDAKQYGVDAVVIGAPSSKNHIKEEEISKVRSYLGEDTLVLCPGVGAQGGEADVLWKHFDSDQVIVNVGRSLMLPKGSNSTPQDQEEAARFYKDLLNKERN